MLVRGAALSSVHPAAPVSKKLEGAEPQPAQPTATLLRQERNDIQPVAVPCRSVTRIFSAPAWRTLCLSPPTMPALFPCLRLTSPLCIPGIQQTEHVSRAEGKAQGTGNRSFLKSTPADAGVCNTITPYVRSNRQLQCLLSPSQQRVQHRG